MFIISAGNSVFRVNFRRHSVSKKGVLLSATWFESHIQQPRPWPSDWEFKLKWKWINLGGQCKSLKSTSRLIDLGSDHLGISFLTSLKLQMFKNTAFVGYFWHFVISCICVFVFVYLTVGNISVDVLGPWAFQKYSIIRFYKVFWAWWRTTKQTNNRVNQE